MSLGQPVESNGKRKFVIWFIAILVIGWALVFKDQLEQARWAWYGFLFLLAVMLLWVFEKNPVVVLAVLLAGMLLVFLYRAYGGQDQETLVPQEPESQPLVAAVPTAMPELAATPAMPAPTLPDCGPDGGSYWLIEPGGFIHSTNSPLALYLPGKEWYVALPDGTDVFIGYNVGSEPIWLKLWNTLCEGKVADFTPPDGLQYEEVSLSRLVKTGLLTEWLDKPAPTD